ncbi:MAG: CCA tRNA nucleotidyltransferase [bacterium]|nr:CCA tRNA nucleotidyltransferase [bacterium]
MNKPLPRIEAAWLQCEQSTKLLALFANNGYTGRFVGGVVRNALLGEPINDFDVATDALPQIVMELAKKAGFKAIGTGLDHGTVTVIVDDKIYEVTTLRVDMVCDGRHASVVFTSNWREDAARRDFTINALYVGLDGVVFDPLDGYKDLLARRVRFIGDAHERIKEDHLRILRFFRFSAQYGQGGVDHAGLDACVLLQQGLQSLSAERISSELMRLLLMPHAFEVLCIMFAHGLLLPLTSRVPHLSRLQKWLTFEQELKLAPRALNRLGVLFMLSTTDADMLASKLRLSNNEKHELKLWVQETDINQDLDEKGARILSYRLQGNYQISLGINWLLSGAGADDCKWRKLYDLPERWQPPAFPLSGQDLLDAGMSPGPSVGKKLMELEEAWLKADFTLSREDMIDRLNTYP